MTERLIMLSEVCSVQSGGTPSRKNEEYWGGAIPWAKISDLEASGDGYIQTTEENITEAGLKAIRGRIFDDDTLLFAMYGSVGKTAIVKGDIATNQAILGIKPQSEKLDLKYLRHWLASQQQKFEQDAQGVAQKNLSAGYIRELEIPLPPLPEQKRIAAILDKADAIRRKRQQAIQLADEFLRSVFLELFGDPVTNPKRWTVMPLSSGIDSITSGWSAKGEGYPCKTNELGVLKISAVTSGKFKPEENKFVYRSDIPNTKKLVFPKTGDLLFSRANTRELVAATCIVPKDAENVFLPDKLWLIETKRDFILPEFLNYLIWQPKFKETLTSQATGTSGSMLNISKKKFEDTEAIFPPITLQTNFSNIYWKIQDILIDFGNSENDLSATFSSLSQKAFAGGLS